MLDDEQDRPGSDRRTGLYSASAAALSRDYDFQFMIEAMAAGAQFNLPYRG